MHAKLKNINDKFVIEWNKESKPIDYDDILDYHILKQWYRNTINFDFASKMELEKVLELKRNKTYDANEGIDVSDFIEIKDNKAYFKEPVKVVNKPKEIDVSYKFNEVLREHKDSLLNDFANYCLINNITFKHSNQISEVINKYLTK